MQHSSDTELYAVASRSPERASEASAQFGIPAHFGSYEDLLADKSIEAVYIPLPNHLHLEWIRKAADAGKHILCEKPLTLNSADTKEGLDYAASKGVLLMEAFMYRFHPQWIRARELAHTGTIGSISAVHTFFAYKNADPKNIRNIAAAGGGALYDIGCYAVSAARFIFGAEPLRAMSLIDRDRTFSIDRLSSGILDFEEGRSVFTVGTQTFPHQRVDIIGTSGSIHVHMPFNTYPDVPATMTVVSGLGERVLSFDPVDQYGLEIDAFSQAVRHGGTTPVPASDANGNASVLDALFRSEESGGWEDVIL